MQPVPGPILGGMSVASRCLAMASRKNPVTPGRAIVELDPEERVARLDDRALALLGCPEDEVQGQPLAILLAEPPQGPLGALREAKSARRPTWLSLRVRARSGAARCLVRVVPFVNGDGRTRTRLELEPR